jgi:hypothetical protein
LKENGQEEYDLPETKYRRVVVTRHGGPEVLQVVEEALPEFPSSATRAGDHNLNLAWGHGGQLIVLVDALDMVVVVTADPLYGQAGEQPWNHEKANINLVADFVSSLSTYPQ